MKSRKRLIRIIITLLIVVLCSTYFIALNHIIEVSEITINIAENLIDYSGLAIAHISDLHLRGKDSSSRLLSLIGEQEPYLIMLTGDIIDRSYDYLSGGLEDFVEGLSKIAPVFCVLGNHEMMSSDKDEFIKIMNMYNVTVLVNEYVIYSYKDKDILILGLIDGGRYNSSEYPNIESYNDSLFIMLAHHPELVINYTSIDNSVVPHLILSGHAHGGQFRLPGVGGIIAPDQGFFPRYDSGLYQVNGSYMYVSRGLGNSVIPIRFNNKQELPIIKLI